MGRLLALSLCAAVAASASVGNAAVINVDINKSASNNYTGVGVAPDTGTVWNALTVSSSNTSSPWTISSVTDSTGAAIANVSISIAKLTTSANTGVKVYDNGHGNPVSLMRDYSYQGSQTTISSLTAGDYTLYVMASAGTAASPQGGTITLDPSNLPSGGTASITTAGTSQDIFDGSNNVINEGVSWEKIDVTVPDGGAGTGSLVFTAGTVINGFQLTSAAVPEPASLSLLGAGALAMLRRRRRA